MKARTLIGLIVISAGMMAACGGKNQSNHEHNSKQTTVKQDPPSYDPKRGEGKFDENNLKIEGLDGALATKGKAISETKCFSCHKATEEKLVGPGWKGVTERRKPHWIMNFITNPDAMIDKDPEVQAQLEICLVRMPDQNLTDDEARNILEFMRQNDGAK